MEPEPDEPPPLYVDSRNGSDLSSGLTPQEPLQTLTAAIAAASPNQQFYLAKNSNWQETFDLRNIPSPQVDSYGAGDLPVIDGSDVVAGWSRVGETNLYEATVSFEAGGRWVVYEDGVMLQRIVDQNFPPTLTQAQLEAQCNATPGSFVDGMGGVDGTPMAGSGQIRIHASTSDNPETNGKVYSISRRTNCIIAGDNAVIRGVLTRRAISNNGSIDLVNTQDGRVEQCLALDGTKHSIGFGSGHARDSIAIRNDKRTHYEQSNAPFVAFLNDGTGSSALIERCGTLGPGDGVDILSHGAPNPLDTFTARQIWAVDNIDMFAGGADRLIGCFYRNVLNIPSETGELSMVLANLDSNGLASGLGNYGGVRMSDCAVKVQSRGDRTPINYNEVFRMRGATGPQILSHCSFYMEEPHPQLINNTNWFANSDSTQDLTFEYNVVMNGVNLMQVASGGSYTGDYNVFLANNRWTPSDTVVFQDPSGYITTLSGWQTATGQDSNSVYLGASDQARGMPHAFWQGVADDINDGPVDGDFRINPKARVYDSTGAAHLGTFADGITPITEAGPQRHWDWNARAEAAGPPHQWPDVADTLNEAREYVSAPEDWNFYPGRDPGIIVERESTGIELTVGETLDFGNVSTSASTSERFTIRNTGRDDLVLSGGPEIVAGGPDTAKFRITSEPASTVIPSRGSATFVVAFQPTGLGRTTATLQIANNSPDRESFYLTVTGTAVIPITDWRQTYFGSPEDSGDGANLNDHDKDGLSNLLEYGFGLNPTLNSEGQFPLWQREDDNFMMNFTEPAGIVGISYGAEWSSTMEPNDWHAITDTGVHPEHEFRVSSGSNSRFFVRVKVSTP